MVVCLPTGSCWGVRINRVAGEFGGVALRGWAAGPSVGGAPQGIKETQSLGTTSCVVLSIFCFSLLSLYYPYFYHYNHMYSYTIILLTYVIYCCSTFFISIHLRFKFSYQVTERQPSLFLFRFYYSYYWIHPFSIVSFHTKIK